MINKIIKKYGGNSNYWYPEVNEINVYVNPEVKEKYSRGCHQLELGLLHKWKAYIPTGWYGFSLGEPCPHVWYKLIDEFLEYFIKLQGDGKINDFEIHQIKIKFGGLRFYVGFSTEDGELREFLELQIHELERHCADEKLIY